MHLLAPYRRQFLVIMLSLSFVLSACDFSGEDPVPTQADFESLGTSTVLTAQAPPANFSQISYPVIDDKLAQLPYSHITINVRFTGVYDDNGERAEGSMEYNAFTNNLANSRIVQLTFEGDIFTDSALAITAARISNSYFMITPNSDCNTNETEVRDIANLGPGQLIGGVNDAGPTGRKDVADDVRVGVEVYEYGFAPEAVVPPQIQTSSDLDFLVGTVWVAPELQIVTQYIVEMNVQNATLLFGQRAVSGRLRYEYNVSEVDIEPNISIPNGC